MMSNTQGTSYLESERQNYGYGKSNRRKGSVTRNYKMNSNVEARRFGTIDADTGKGGYANMTDFLDKEIFDETKLSSTQKVEYRQLIGEIDTKLSEIDEQRGKLDSMGTGEIYSLAAATVIHAEFVCSNDYSVHEVIEALSLEVYPCGNDELEPRLLVQHKFIQF